MQLRSYRKNVVLWCDKASYTGDDAVARLCGYMYVDGQPEVVDDAQLASAAAAKKSQSRVVNDADPATQVCPVNYEQIDVNVDTLSPQRCSYAYIHTLIFTHSRSKTSTASATGRVATRVETVAVAQRTRPAANWWWYVQSRSLLSIITCLAFSNVNTVLLVVGSITLAAVNHYLPCYSLVSYLTR
jgi:hypothetical protein